MTSNQRAKVTVVAEREVPPPADLAANAAWALEQRAVGSSGEAANLALVAAFGRNVVAIAASAAAEPWSWVEVGELVALQATRLPD
jgi:hypothetical protein